MAATVLRSSSMCIGPHVQDHILPAPRTLKNMCSDAHLHPVVERDSVLSEFIHLWHDNIASRSSELHLQWVRAMRQFGAARSGKLQVGTMFSGSDIAHLCIDELCAYWEKMYRISIVPEFKFMCESDPSKQRFLIDQFHPNLLFSNASDLGNVTAPDVISRSHALVPWTDLLLAGFPCVDRSSLSSRASSMKGCVRSGEGSTGEGFKHVLGYVDSAGPDLIVLENVPNLTVLAKTADDDALECDADFVVDAFRKRLYLATFLVFQAQDHGSFPPRRRCYFVAIKAPPGTTLTSCTLAASYPFTMMNQVILSTAIGPNTYEKFMFLESVTSCRQDSTSSAVAEGALDDIPCELGHVF